MWGLRPAADADLSVLAQVGYARELLARLGIERFAAVGHAHGGGVAQLLALKGGVETMILLDSIAFDAWPSEAFGELQRSAPEAPSASLVRAVVRTRFDLGHGAPPESLGGDWTNTAGRSSATAAPPHSCGSPTPSTERG